MTYICHSHDGNTHTDVLARNSAHTLLSLSLHYKTNTPFDSDLLTLKIQSTEHLLIFLLQSKFIARQSVDQCGTSGYIF